MAGPRIARREFMKRGAGTLAATIAASTLTTMGTSLRAVQAAPKAAPKIKWRLQTYAGSTLGQFVIKNSIDAFNIAANGEMEIALYFADEIVPQGELIKAMQRGVLDAVQTDEDSAQSPIDVSVFGAYFPLASQYSLDVPALWHWYGLDKIWREAYAKVPNVTFLSMGSWDPCNFATTKPVNSLADFKGLRVYMFPTGGQFMRQFGVVPVSLPYEDVQMAVQTKELDGVTWSGITEDYTVGWADVTKYFLTNPISGAWAGAYLVNTKSWEKLPKHLQEIYRLSMWYSHYYRLHWYWRGEAHYRVNGGKLKLTTIPESEWKEVRAAALKFWDDTAKKSARNAQVVKILKDYNRLMEKAGPPYRYT
jgi:TRAP-type mannitol/chloroaromatic compound transport system substrate-binding protein